jgi:hypothetical protein
MNKGREAELLLKEIACLDVRIALMRNRLSRSALKLPGVTFWRHLTLLWRSVRAELIAKRRIRDVAVLDPQWSRTAMKKFQDDLKVPLQVLPDGSFFIGDGITLKVSEDHEQGQRSRT